jgi:hypothetical protein
MRVSLAAFTSEAVAPGGIPWVELSRIMYRDTRRGRAVTIKTNEKSKRKGLGKGLGNSNQTHSLAASPDVRERRFVRKQGSLSAFFRDRI